MEGVIIVCVLFSAVAGAVYAHHKNEEKKLRFWKSFADQHGLNYYPSSIIGGGTSVEGNYHGHQIKLEMKGSGNQQLTRFIILNIEFKGLRSNQGEPDAVSPAMPVDELTDELFNVLEIYDAKIYKPVKTDLPFGNALYIDYPGFVIDTDVLVSVFDILTELADLYIEAVKLGGEAFFPLHDLIVHNDNSFKKVIVEMMRVIGNRSLFINRTLPHVCPECLTYYIVHEVSVSRLRFDSIEYYSCRLCRLNKKHLEGTAVAVLDRNMTEKYELKYKNVYINWLTVQAPVDFEKVEIRNASDDDVERFVVMVDNDTDNFRIKLYRKAQCVISPGCELSVNTHRILERTFPDLKK